VRNNIAFLDRHATTISQWLRINPLSGAITEQNGNKAGTQSQNGALLAAMTTVGVLAAFGQM